jgi:hypothetical protein
MPHSCSIFRISRNLLFRWVYLTISRMRFLYTHDAIIVDVVAPSLPYHNISMPICLLVLLNLCMHYFYVINTPPGFVDKPPPDSGYSLLWPQKPDLDKGKKTTVRSTSWSEKGINITPASTNECHKCKKVRPEVSLIFFYESCQIKVTVKKI